MLGWLDLILSDNFLLFYYFVEYMNKGTVSMSQQKENYKSILISCTL